MILSSILISLLFVLGLSVIYHRYPSLRETLVFLGTGIGLTAAIASAIFTYCQVSEATKQSQMAADQIAEAGRQNRLALIHSQQAEAFVLIDKYNALPLRTTSDFVRSFRGKTPEEINALHQSNPDAAEALRACMSFFENASLSIRAGFADDQISCQHFRGTAVLYYEHLEEYVRAFRERTANQEAWVHYEWLYRQWKNGCPKLEEED